METPVGRIPQVRSTLSGRDRWGGMKARWGVGRMDYLIEPGLYALNRPDQDSPVLVTANYKLTFDLFRSALPGLNAWILVLETYGINVWCAAGKGTFGTEELVRRIKESNLAEVVAHREVILPQLGAPGVAARGIRKATGFEALFGPVMARDLPKFLASGNKATPEMRNKDFPFRERLVLIPIELVAALKILLPAGAVMLLLVGLFGPAGFAENIRTFGLFPFIAILTAVAAGTVALPLLLPWLPGRAFALKGAVVGAAAALGLAVALNIIGTGPPSSLKLESAAWMILVPALAAFLGMNFTGSSTYTSLSGVRKEMRRAVPAQIGAGVVGLALWVGSWLVI